MPPPHLAGPLRVQRLIYAYRSEGSRGDVVVARIGAPLRRPEGGWAARVECPAVLTSGTWMAGASAAQARELATALACDTLRHKGFTVSASPMPATLLTRRRLGD